MKTEIRCGQCGDTINGSFYALRVNDTEKTLCQQCVNEKLPTVRRLKPSGRSPGPILIEIHIGVSGDNHRRGEVRFIIPRTIVEENLKNLFNGTEA